jgi:DNA polymerase III delta prime subunit
MPILEHLDKNNLHHAYLIEGAKDEIIPEIVKFLKSININTVGNSDFVQINLDSFKIEDARNLKSYATEKSFSIGKKIFLISANSFLLEAQNSLLKMFEEPIENTHFFLVVPDTNALLKTFISRFYLVSARQDLAEETKEAEKFIAMPLKNRIDFMKELLAETEDEDITTDSNRSKAIKFLNALEAVMSKAAFDNDKNMSRTVLDTKFCEHLFKVREFLRMPGSSTKTLMESVALIMPNMQEMQSR